MNKFLRVILVLALGMHGNAALAAVPVAVMDIINTAGLDAVSVAVLVLIAFFSVYLIAWMRQDYSNYKNSYGYHKKHR